MPLTAADTTSLITDLDDANATASGSVTIDITNNITLSAALPAISLAAGVSLTIDGGNTLDGTGTYRGFAVLGGTVTLQNLTITHALAEGAVGGLGGGGGGAGLGGGLFVGSEPGAQAEVASPRQNAGELAGAGVIGHLENRSHSNHSSLRSQAISSKPSL